MKKYTLLRTFMLFIAALILCGWFSIHTQAAITKGVKAPEQTVCFEPDTTSVLKNPLTGWVMYLGRAWDENFWQTQRYDAMPVNGGDSTVSSETLMTHVWDRIHLISTGGDADAPPYSSSQTHSAAAPHTE